MRAVIYARYLHRPAAAASIEDQSAGLPRAHRARGLDLPTHAYCDRAMSGTSRFRPGYQKLLEDARHRPVRCRGGRGPRSPLT